jgi:DNA invertase Pin-like site-specific DNA recombinase
MTKRVAFYLRVSTGDGQQTIDNQRQALDEIAKRAGWGVVEVYSDEISGTKGRERRPAFDRMLKAAVHRKFDMIAAWSVDRLGRSLQDLVAFLSELKSAGVDLFLHQQALDTSTPSGRALFQMLGVFAEFEAAMIRERTRAGLVRARAQGKRLGRPPVTRAISAAVLRSLADGLSIRKAAKLHRVGISSVQRIKSTDAQGKLG